LILCNIAVKEICPKRWLSWCSF